MLLCKKIFKFTKISSEFFLFKRSGWGGTRTAGPAPNILQWITKTTISNDDCRSRLPDDQEFISDSKICTYTRVGEGICQGDSGGLVEENFFM